jgi:sigma-B regulation protein RsbU (phosphoserine phosphatase)
MKADHISRVIFDYAGRIGNVHETGAFLRLNADMARDLVDADRCSIWLIDAERQELWTTVAHGVPELRVPLGHGLVGAAIHDGVSIVVNDPSSDPRFLNTGAQSGYETTSLLVIPLRSSDEKVIGALQALNKPGGFQEEDVELLGLAATYAANALETQRLRNEAITARLVQKEIEIASRVQRHLFPQSLPKFDQLECAAFCRPARWVGGDYYDFIPLPGGGLMMTLGDVAGKGIAAAVMMASLQASIRSQAMHLHGSLAHIMEGFNKAVCSYSTVDKYSTLFLSVLEPGMRKMTYVNAGGCRPMLLRNRDASVELLAAGGMPVGLVPDITYRQGEVILEPGDVILSCSDGVSESMNRAEEFWDDAHVERVLRENAARPAAEIIDRLVAAVDQFADGADQHDDITVTVLKAV